METDLQQLFFLFFFSLFSVLFFFLFFFCLLNRNSSESSKHFIISHNCCCFSPSYQPLDNLSWRSCRHQLPVGLFVEFLHCFLSIRSLYPPTAIFIPLLPSRVEPLFKNFPCDERTGFFYNNSIADVFRQTVRKRTRSKRSSSSTVSRPVMAVR